MRDHVLYRPVVKILSVLLFEYLIEYASSRQIPVLLIRSIRAAQWPVTLQISYIFFANVYIVGLFLYTCLCNIGALKAIF